MIFPVIWESIALFACHREFNKKNSFTVYSVTSGDSFPAKPWHRFEKMCALRERSRCVTFLRPPLCVSCVCVRVCVPSLLPGRASVFFPHFVRCRLWRDNTSAPKASGNIGSKSALNLTLPHRTVPRRTAPHRTPPFLISLLRSRGRARRAARGVTLLLPPRQGNQSKHRACLAERAAFAAA